MASEKILNQKQQQVEKLREKILKAKSIILVDYRGLTVEEDTDLRNKLRKANLEYKVIKNTLILFAVRDGDLKELSEYLNGPTAVAFSFDDEMAPSKILAEYAKKNEKLELKGGIVDGKIVNANEIKIIATIPPKEVLISKLMGSLNAPASGLVNVLNGNIRGLVVALNAIAQKQK